MVSMKWRTRKASRKLSLHWTQHPVKARGLYTSEHGRLKLLNDWTGRVKIRVKQNEKWVDRTVNYPSEDFPFILDGKRRSPWYDWRCRRAASAKEIAQELDLDYLGSDYQFFDANVINRVEKEMAQPPFKVGDLDYNLDTLEPIGFVEREGGPLKIWFNPQANGFPKPDEYVCGADVAMGSGGKQLRIGSVQRENVGENS